MSTVHQQHVGSAQSPQSTNATPADVAAASAKRIQERTSRISLLSTSLGTAGVGGAWDSAVATLDAPQVVSDVLFAMSGLIWILLLVQYLGRGGWRFRHISHDLHHPQLGFAFAYIPIIGMLAAGHFSRLDLTSARWVYAVSAALTVAVAARLLAHWVTGGLRSTPLHPGYLLPLSSGPFIASSVASSLLWPHAAASFFAVGVLYWLAFGTVILVNLVHSASDLPAVARPTLSVLIVPPATGGLAWVAAHRGMVDQMTYGFLGLLIFTILITLFLLPQLRQPNFHQGIWVFLFPAAASSNFLIRWVHGADVPNWHFITWALVTLVSAALLVLAAATLKVTLRERNLKR
ncbi:hypothetical protein [Streptomyces bauhiniae]|uniref:SLAC1 family transporter n=1 Tax=Streptomyces bauhiniae TaxID=2340725 RepID=UPI003655B6B8